MTDKHPTRDISRHNYVVLSEITPDTEKVLCFSITSCRRGIWEGVIPIVSTNGYEAFVDTHKVYEFTPDEFAEATYHGAINGDWLDLLVRIYLLTHGLLTDKEVVRKTSEEWSRYGVNINNATPYVIKRTEDVEESETNEAPKLEAAKADENDVESETEKEIEINNEIELPKRVSGWTDEQLNLVLSLINAKEWEKVKKICCINALASCYHKRDAIRKEIEKREEKKRSETPMPSKFSNHVSNGYGVGFWLDGDLIRFYLLYTIDDRNNLRKELGETISSIRSKYSTVKKELDRRGIKLDK